MFFPLINELLNSSPDGRSITVRGWVRTKREMKNLVFIEVNDGSCFRSIQCTFDTANLDSAAANALADLGTGTAVEIQAVLVPSPASGQTVEAAASSLVTCSCSQALDEARFRRMVNEAAADAERRLIQLDFRYQSPDHPILMGYDESLYLKCGFYLAV